MKIKNKKPILGVITLLSLLVMSVTFSLSSVGVTFVSGFVLFIMLIVAISRFIDVVKIALLTTTFKSLSSLLIPQIFSGSRLL